MPGHDRWVLYSTFDAEGEARSFVVDQLRAYRAAGFQTLVIDTSPRTTAARAHDWQTHATATLHRENEGYDFGSWKAGLRWLADEARVDLASLNLVLANDSCFGPFSSLEDLIARFDARPRDQGRVFGITDSLQETSHIQSYWLYFRADVSRHAVDFFAAMPALDGRKDAILHGELALSAYLASRGCRREVRAPAHTTLRLLANRHLWPLSVAEFGIRRLLRRWKYNEKADMLCLRHLLGYPDKLQHFNPILLFGVHLHRRRLVPFVKRSMIRDNNYNDPAIPTGVDITHLSNHDVERLLEG